MAFLLCLYLLAPNFILRYSITPRFQISNARGEALKPLVITVKTVQECRQIGISVDGPRSYVSQKDMPEDGSTLRVEYPITQGSYRITLACLDGAGGILQLVDAGSAEVS
jgi:hypothetical protein